MDNLSARKGTHEYIDRQAVLDVLLDELCGTGYQSRGMSAVMRVPAAEVESVRYGRWIWVDEDECFVCSRCEESALDCFLLRTTTTRFCPHCGAKMET